MVKVVLIFLVSWLGAVVAFSGYSWLAGGRASVADVVSLSVWGGLASLSAVALALAPVMFTMRNRFRSVWLFIAAGAGLAVIPLVLFAVLWNSLAGLFSGVGALFFAVFMGFGVCFGAGFHWSYVRNSA